MIGAICYKVTNEYEARIYLVGTYEKIEWTKELTCALGSEFSLREYSEPMMTDAFSVIDSIDGKKVLRLFETRRYIVKLIGNSDNAIPVPHFQNENNKFLKLEKDSDSVIFQFINYLGRSRISFDTVRSDNDLIIEVVPEKMEYENDYIKLTESIAQICSELLLEHAGSTSNLYSLSEDDAKTILEQFIFLRQFCYSQNIRSLFESIRRNPDRLLYHEDNLEKIGNGAPSRKFYTNPFSNSRGWIRVPNEVGKGTYIPQEVSVTRKYDSLDTPANRFIKFALQKFDQICLSLIAKLAGEDCDKTQGECIAEATEIHRMLADIFCDTFFSEIGELDIMPQNNQVLQKREGYSQIFAAYSMIDLALQLDWSGKDEIYEGESKNVALLYEYWLFFELYKIVSSIDDCELICTNEDDFITYSDAGITISLEEGKKSRQSFVIRHLHTKINLYYNRTFSRKEFKSTLYEGSYSRPFRPDYTLAIFPDIYCKGANNGENEAVKNGAVNYVHFDAKYRISDITSLIGNENIDDDELIDDKTDSIVNTYKRGDLLKMHTYNDAIRRTIGSYVLYPGRDDISEKRDVEFRLYDEILPGVGAFAIRPSIDERGENELKRFITALLETKGVSNSRLNRMHHYMEMVLREPAIPELSKKYASISTSDFQQKRGEQCVLGYIKADSDEDYYYSLQNNNLLTIDSEFLFYFYAIKGSNIYSHHNDVFNSTDFCFYTNSVNESNLYCLEPVLGKIISNELVSRKDLVAKLRDRGIDTSEEKHYADFYYVLRVRVVETDCERINLDVKEINSMNGNDTFSVHSPKVIKWKELSN